MKRDDQNQKHKKIKISFKSIFDVIGDEISKIISFKIKKNQALNQTQIIIKGETKMTDGVVKRGKSKTKKVPELHPEIKQFMEEQKKFNTDVKEFMQDQNKKWEEQNKRWEEQIKFNNDIKKFVKEQTKINKDVKNFINNQQETNQVLLTSIKEILLRLERIEKCPTIKKELDELE